MVEITEEPDEALVIPAKTEPEISVEKPSEIAEDSDSDLEQFYDALGPFFLTRESVCIFFLENGKS